jgi:hypothetical protein
MQYTVYPNGQAQITVPNGSKIAFFTRGTAKLSKKVAYPNQPDAVADVTSVTNDQYVSAAVTADTVMFLAAGAAPVYYEVGTAPVVGSEYATQIQGAPVAVDATGAVSSAAMLGGIVTSSTAAAVAGTVPTGTVLDAAAQFNVGDSFDWSVIVTGGTNDFTVTAATDHTLVGNAVVTHSTSGLFRTRKTATNTFVTYRLS